MTLDSFFEILNRKLIETRNRPLTSPEKLILKGIWQYHTYNQIAQQAGYSPGYLTNVVAPELCHRLSKLIGQRVTKKNCRTQLELYAAAQAEPEETQTLVDPAHFSLNTSQDISLCYPNGSVSLDSNFYIKDYKIEAEVYQEIKKPGALIRIKAPREMGKTSLLLRILDYANGIEYRTVSLNLEQVDLAILSDLNRFLRWLCANVTRQLQIESKLDEYWDEDIGSKVSCSLYFRSYILQEIDSPFVLALDEVNQIFEHPQVARDVLSMLRSWHEEAKRVPVWQKLRLIVVHSTDVYVPLNLNQSPFNVGLPIQLNEFNLNQIQELAQRYHLNWTDGSEAQQLIELVGGHPLLIQIALYHLSRQDITLPELLETAPTSSGIYSNHLHRLWANLREQPELADAVNMVMNATEPVSLEPIIAYKLSSMGLVKVKDNRVRPSYQLYQIYFQARS